MKYVVTYKVALSEKRHIDRAKAFDVKETSTSTFEIGSLKACKNILIDILDVPIMELSLEDVRRNFTVCGNGLSEKKAMQIQNYYNGRLALYNVMLKELNKKDGWHLLKYSIPKEYASFCDDCMTSTDSAMITIERA